LVKQVK